MDFLYKMKINGQVGVLGLGFKFCFLWLSTYIHSLYSLATKKIQKIQKWNTLLCILFYLFYSNLYLCDNLLMFHVHGMLPVNCMSSHVKQSCSLVRETTVWYGSYKIIGSLVGHIFQLIFWGLIEISITSSLNYHYEDFS